MRAALIGLIALAALPTAPAAAWQELPFRTLPGRNSATCLRATGLEGGLAAIGPVGRRSTPLDLLAAGANGPAVRVRVRFGVARGCPAVAEQGGAGVVASPVIPLGRRTMEMRAAVRDPGGGFGALMPLGRAAGAYDAAVSARGDALVAWVQARGGEASRRARVVVARRAPGAPFGPVEALTAWSGASRYIEPRVAGALDRDGRATVAWARQRPDSRADDGQMSVEVATAPAGAAFGPAQVLARRTAAVERLALAVATGGRALLVHDGDELVRLFERAPGAAAFGLVRQLGQEDEYTLVPTSDPALALRDDGAAVVAWRGGGRDEAVRAMMRPAGGAFGAGRVVAAGRRDSGFGTGLSAFSVAPRDRALAPSDHAGLTLRAVVSATGRVALAWTARRSLIDAPLAPFVATGSLDGGFGAPSVLGSPTRSAAGVAALLLPGGEPAVAWVDNTAHTLGFGSGDLELFTGGGRVHLARADAAAGPAAPPPAARLRAPRRQRLYLDGSVRATVRCAAACDVRVYIPRGVEVGAGGGKSLAGGVTTAFGLTAGGSGELIGRHRRRATVVARVSAPGSRAVRLLRRRIVLVRRPEPPAPRPLDARAVRRGRAIVVSWRTALPAWRATFTVRTPSARRTLFGRGRTRFSVTLTPKRPAAIRRVVIAGVNYEQKRRAVTVPVTR